MTSKKLKIAVTGGIGSGKSEVCKVFNEKGYIIINADEIGKNLLNSDKKVISKIKAEFGDSAYLNGKVNADSLSSIVFADKNKLSKINSIIHPETIKIINQEMEKVLKKHDLVFVESALIFEIKREKFFDYVLLVVSDENLRIGRLKKYKGVDPRKVKERIFNQLPDEQKIIKADFIIRNNSSLEELRKNAEFFLRVFENSVAVT